MTTLVQRPPSTVSVDYFNPKQDNFMMDADAEMCRLFGSLNLTACAPIQHQGKQPIVQEVPPVVHSEDDASMAIETMIDGEGNVQFIESTTPMPETYSSVDGCGLIQTLAAHYAPSLSRLHCITRDPDFNLLETILAHREAFVTFPFGHRTCSISLTQIAWEIERRNNAGMPYHEDADIDTAIALHNEAWLMSGWYSK